MTPLSSASPLFLKGSARDTCQINFYSFVLVGIELLEKRGRFQLYLGVKTNLILTEKQSISPDPAECDRDFFFGWEKSTEFPVPVGLSWPTVFSVTIEACPAIFFWKTDLVYLICVWANRSIWKTWVGKLIGAITWPSKSEAVYSPLGHIPGPSPSKNEAVCSPLRRDYSTPLMLCQSYEVGNSQGRKHWCLCFLYHMSSRAHVYSNIYPHSGVLVWWE